MTIIYIYFIVSSSIQEWYLTLDHPSGQVVPFTAGSCRNSQFPFSWWLSSAKGASPYYYLLFQITVLVNTETLFLVLMQMMRLP